MLGQCCGTKKAPEINPPKMRTIWVPKQQLCKATSSILLLMSKSGKSCMPVANRSPKLAPSKRLVKALLLPRYSTTIAKIHSGLRTTTWMTPISPRRDGPP